MSRSPSCYSPVNHSSTSSKLEAFPFDLHVLSTPPAFILSQDQTLHKKIRRKKPNTKQKRQTTHTKRLNPMCEADQKLLHKEINKPNQTISPVEQGKSVYLHIKYRQQLHRFTMYR